MIFTVWIVDPERVQGMNEEGMSSWKHGMEFTCITTHNTFKGMDSDESVGSICFVEGEYG